MGRWRRRPHPGAHGCPILVGFALFGILTGLAVVVGRILNGELVAPLPAAPTKAPPDPALPAVIESLASFAGAGSVSRADQVAFGVS